MAAKKQLTQTQWRTSKNPEAMIRYLGTRASDRKLRLFACACCRQAWHFVKDKRFVPETYAYGLRNPWRITCDAKTGHIWVGQNGQDLWEQAFFVRPGENYGWSVTEGSHPFYLERKRGRRTIGVAPFFQIR